MPKPLRLAFVILACLCSAVVPLPAIAQEQEVEREPPADVQVVASLWCDTADQLETVLRAHYTDKVPMGQAMAEINRDNPEACVVARAIVKLGVEVRRVTAGDAVMSLREARVHGIMRGRYALMMRPQTWFCVQIVAELTPL